MTYDSIKEKKDVELLKYELYERSSSIGGKYEGIYG